MAVLRLGFLLFVALIVHDYIGTFYSIVLLISIAGLMIAGIVLAEKSNAMLDKSIETKITKSTEDHLDALVRKRISSVSKDSYGVTDGKKWQTECNYFFNNVVLESFDKPEIERYANYDNDRKSKMGALIENIVVLKQENLEREMKFDQDMDPYQYEKFCALLARKSGWHASATSGSGDQGVDVIARKDGHTLVIQCKKYSSPVGNKAVQEVIAAREFIRADSAAVVSNNTYTKSAKELARASHVYLWHHSDLVNLDRSLRGEDISAREVSENQPIDFIL